MTGDELARSYLEKASVRLDVLKVLLDRGAYSDVVREAQELVEIALKAALRLVGIDPPRIHDVGPVLVEHIDAYPGWLQEVLPRLAEISRWLRHEREMALYGDVDVIPTETYAAVDAEKAMADASTVYDAVRRLLEERSSEPT